MRILVVNDDGINASGILLLASKLKKYGEVIMVAPNEGRSAASHSILLKKPIVFEKINDINGIEAYSCSGMPADCVRLATSVIKKQFDIVFSGINDGLNCGTDIIYSGTVAGAKEAIIEGIPGVSISQDKNYNLKDYEVEDLLDYIMENKLYSTNYVLNVNFPTNDHERSLGYRFCKQGIKSFKTEFFKNNKGYYDEVNINITYDMDPNTDVYLGKMGYTTFVPVGLDQTNHQFVNILKKFERD